MKKYVYFLTYLSVFLSFSIVAAPYNGDIEDFDQPDGSVVQVKLYGDEYYMRGESLDGYTLIRDDNGWLCYAELNTEGFLQSTGIPYTQGSRNANLKTTNGVLEKGIDVSSEKRRDIVKQNKDALGSIDFEKRPDSSPNARTLDFEVKGKYKALVVLVDFIDKPSEVPKEIINDMFNSKSFSYNGNNGSINQYFTDVSGGLVDYEGVVFGYFRAPKTFAEYDNGPYGTTAQEILGLALKWIDNQGFDFSTLHTTNGRITAINLMYTGTPKAWAEGMWYHASSYYGFRADGVQSGSYNTSPAKSNLTIGTTVHENGHMLCKWPDLYSYDAEKTGNDGIGSFCVMASGNGKNPEIPNPYFRSIAGWIKPTEVYGFSGVITESHDDFKVYKYTNPNNSSEFFLTDVRYRDGRSANIPGNGLTIWHIDRTQDQQKIHDDNGGGANHREVYLEHANNDITKRSGACFHAASKNEFNDNSTPNAKWYNNSNSGLKISEISAAGRTMTYRFGVISQEIKEPYTGIPIAIPGVLEVENYDKGGEGISYHDTDNINNGENYRNDGVDIGGTTDNYVVGWTAPGEWLEYTVNVDETTTYKAEFLTSSLNGGGSLNLEFDGKSVLASTEVSSSSGWNTYTSFTKEVSLTKGKHIIRINIEKAGFNLDKVIFTKVATCSLTSYINVNETGLKVENTMTTAVGSSVLFGPQSSTTQFQNTSGWLWTGPNNFTSDKRENILNDIQEVNAGVYHVSYTDPDGCTATLEIVINPPCDVIPYVNINNQGWGKMSDIKVNVGDEVWFGPQSNISGAAVAGWSWSGPNNLSHENRTLVIEHIGVNEEGKYTANYITSDGCKSSHDFMVSVSTITALVNSINNELLLSIYPNPNTNGQFRLNQSVDWEIYSFQGIMIRKGESEFVDLSGEAKGIYFLKTPSSIHRIVYQ
jgi:M6 family metalloprotease-like protein